MYNLWRTAVMLMHRREHLTSAGRAQLILLRQGIQALVITAQGDSHINITANWLLGFIEGDGSFSTNKLVPRLKLENSIGDTSLLQAIQSFLGLGNVRDSDRNRSAGEKPTTVLEINKCGYSFNILIPMLSPLTWYTKKLLDFQDWSLITLLYWHGYHTLPQGASLILLLKYRMNNYRLKTDPNYNGDMVIDPAVIKAVLDLPAFYEIHNGFRTFSGTTNLVSEDLCILATKEGVTLEFTSLSTAGKALHIDRTKIKNCILSGTSYKGYLFTVRS